MHKNQKVSTPKLLPALPTPLQQLQGHRGEQESSYSSEWQGPWTGRGKLLTDRSVSICLILLGKPLNTCRTNSAVQWFPLKPLPALFPLEKAITLFIGIREQMLHFLFCNHLLIALILKSGFGNINGIQPSLISLQEQCTLQKSGIPEPAVPLHAGPEWETGESKALRKMGICAMEKGEFPASIYPAWL